MGFPWLAALVARLAIARLAIDHPSLLRIHAASWLFWLAVGAVAVPMVVTVVSMLVMVRLVPTRVTVAHVISTSRGLEA